MKHVAIILTDTLTALGIKYLLHENFPACAYTYESLSQFQGEKKVNFDLLVTNGPIFLDNLQFFLPNKDKTIVVSSELCSSIEANRINSHDQEAGIVDILNKFLKASDNQEPQGRLTQRETSVLQLVAQGCTNKEIADRLNISFNTVLSHRKNITAKLGIKSVSGLSLYAMMNGLITTSW